MAGSSALQNVDHSWKLDNVRLIVEAPLVGIHQAVVVLVHGLVHPDRVGHVEADGHVKLRSLFPNGVDARVVRMQSRCGGFAGAQALALVMNLADAFSTEVLAAFEFL